MAIDDTFQKNYVDQNESLESDEEYEEDEIEADMESPRGLTEYNEEEVSDNEDDYSFEDRSDSVEDIEGVGDNEEEKEPVQMEIGNVFGN